MPTWALSGKDVAISTSTMHHEQAPSGPGEWELTSRSVTDDCRVTDNGLIVSRLSAIDAQPELVDILARF